MFILILLSCILIVQSYNIPNESDNKDHLEFLATNIMDEMNKGHIPSESAHSGVHNAPLHQFINGAYAQKYLMNDKKVDNIKVTVGVKGYRFVSVQQNDKVINVTTAFGVGAGAIYKISHENQDFQSDEIDEMTEGYEIEELLVPVKYEYIDTAPVNNGTIGLLMGQKAKFGMKVKQRNKEMTAKVLHGYIIGAKTNITRSG